MIYVEAPNTYIGTELSLFLAGGITDCPNWQHELVRSLSNTKLALYNPRRANFPIHDPSAANGQIEWEIQYLQKASAISFWFCRETLCPIVLYELGLWSQPGGKPIFVGVDPEYQRKLDVIIQTANHRPEVMVVHSLEDLASQIIDWYLT